MLHVNVVMLCAERARRRLMLPDGDVCGGGGCGGLRGAVIERQRRDTGDARRDTRLLDGRHSWQPGGTAVRAETFLSAGAARLPQHHQSRAAVIE